MLPGALQHNERGHFECRWVSLQPSSQLCVWTRALEEPVRCPVAHGEGRYVAGTAVLEQLRSEDRVAFRYAADDYPANPNGSAEAIAGVCDSTGLVLGMMPHQENHVTERQGRAIVTVGKEGHALPLFRNGVAAARAS